MGIIDDVRYACRALRRDPLFSLAAAATLAISLGANTAMFTVVKAVLIAPLAMRDPGRLVALSATRADGRQYPFNIPNLLDVRSRNQVLEEVAAYGGWNANVTGEANPERLIGVRATGNYFSMIGVQAVLGRALEPADDEPGHAKVVVITYGLWERRYGSDRGVLGRTILLNGEPHTMVGVLPRSFSFRLANTEFAVPLAAATDPTRAARASTSFLRVTARVKAGVPAVAVQSDLDRVMAELRRDFPVENARYTGMQIVPLQEDITGASRPMLTILFAAVGVVLVIACANIASLMIARSVRRRKDLAVRAALGGGPWRLARQFVMEAVILSGMAGVAGIGLAHWGVQLLLAMSPASLPRASEIQIDGTVLAAAFGASLLSGILFSIGPALHAARTDLNHTLRTEGRSGAGSVGAARLRGAIVVAEVALSLVLLTAAGLLIRSVARLTATDPGFRTADVLTLRLALPGTRYRAPAATTAFHDALHRKFAAMPQVVSAGMISILPMSGPIATADFSIVGDAPKSVKEKPSAEYRVIDWSWFSTVGVPIRRGRDFTPHDNVPGHGVVVISESLARLYWGGREPVGTHILMQDNGAAGRDLEVVGVAGDVRETSLDKAPAPCAYVPMGQIPPNLVRFLTNNMFWAVRARPGVNLTGAVRAEVQQVDGDVAIAAAPFQDYLDKAAATYRFTLRILIAFAMAAVLLAACGLYAVVAYATAQRRREIGVRMALGARPAQVAGMVMRHGLLLVAAGVLLGCAASYAASRYLVSLLFEVSPHDGWALGGAAILMALAAAAATWLPVRRAISVDPLLALRSE